MKGKNKMTRENYFALKKALMNVVCSVTKKGDYITIEPDHRDEFRTVDVLTKYLDDAGIEYDLEKFCRIGIIHTEYGDLKWVSGKHSNTHIYSARYRIISE